MDVLFLPDIPCFYKFFKKDMLVSSKENFYERRYGMIHWVYREEETGNVKEGTTGKRGNFRKQLQEVQSRKQNRNQRLFRYGKRVTAVAIAVLCLGYFRSSLYTFGRMEAHVEQGKTEMVSAEPVLQVSSGQVVVEELDGQVSRLPLSNVTESPEPVMTPISTPTPSTEKSTSASVPQTKEYIVQPGDTIASISRKHYGTMEMMKKICELNEISDGDYIQVGEKIVLP